jgi:diacylglycerol O-acyltransferase
VFAQMLDRSKPLWEVWMVDGLEDGRWAIISKVHHCMVDGVSATDLLTLIFDVSEDASPLPERVPWAADDEPGILAVTLHGVARAVAEPVERALSTPARMRVLARRPSERVADATRLVRSLGEWARRSATSLNGPIGPHRRWSWAEASLDDVKTIRGALGHRQRRRARLDHRRVAHAPAAPR